MPGSQPQHPVQKEHSHNGLGNFLLGLGLTTVGLSFIPELVRKFGSEETEQIIKAIDGGCCPVVEGQAELQGTGFKVDSKKYGYGYVSGVAGTMSHLTNRIPEALEKTLKIEGLVDQALNATGAAIEKVANSASESLGLKIEPLKGVADNLKRPEVKLSLLGSALTLLSHGAGNIFGGKVGDWVRNGMQLVGLGFLIPAIMPAIGHAAISLSAAAGIDQIDVGDGEDPVGRGPATAFAALIGKAPGDCWLERGKTVSGKLTGSFMALCCGIPALIAAATAIFGGGFGKKKAGNHSDGGNHGGGNADGSKPSGDYGAMTDEQLQQAHQAKLKEAEAIEKPGTLRKIWNWSVKGVAGIATFAASIWLADKSYLKPQRDKIADFASGNYATNKQSLLEFVPTIQGMYDQLDAQEKGGNGKILVWPCKCSGCVGGMNGRCAPSLIKLEDYEKHRNFFTTPLTRSQLDEFARHPNNSDYPAKIPAFFETRVGKKDPNRFIKGLDKFGFEIAPFKPPTAEEKAAKADVAIKHLRNQEVFAAASSAGVGFGVFKLVEKWLDKPKEHLGHIKSEISRIETELAVRAAHREHNRADGLKMAA